MRLINCSTMKLDEFLGIDAPPYAILSHTWEKEEVSFIDFTHDQAAATSKAGYRKIELTCEQARKDGISYAWVDTCCIDKSSSAELSEAINSMFKWYRDAAICYAYLSDVSKADFETSFKESRWFTRGWTLQELLAPNDLTFYDREWKSLGTRLEHVNAIHDVTVIDISALSGLRSSIRQGTSLSSFCVAKRLSWASNRTTTREEDRAYSLLGIFEVNIPLLYGEGSQAFHRLQEEIIRKHGSPSILAWGLRRPLHPQLTMDDLARNLGGHQVERNQELSHSELRRALASSPSDFSDCWDLDRVAWSASTFTITHIGLHVELLTVPVLLNGIVVGWIGLLGCSPDPSSFLLGIIFRRPSWPSYSKNNARRQRVKVKLASEYYSTVLVDPDLAFEAVSQSIIIQRKDYTSSSRYAYHDKVFVRITETLSTIGYSIVSVTEGNPDCRSTKSNQRSGSESSLDFGGMQRDQSSQTITFSRLLRKDDDFCGCVGSFILKNEASNDEMTSPTAFDHRVFTLFVFQNSSRIKTIVRQGVTFSGADVLEMQKCLSVQHDDYHEDVFDYDGHAHRIIINIQANVVYHWKIFKVTVNAVRVTGNATQPESLEASDLAQNSAL